MMATYTITAIGPNRTFACKVAGAPNDSRIANFAEAKHCPLATRYFPSKKGWVLFDLRTAVKVNMGVRGRNVAVWKGIKRHPKLFTTEDAAVMWAMHKLQANSQLPLDG